MSRQPRRTHASRSPQEYGAASGSRTQPTSSRTQATSSRTHATSSRQPATSSRTHQYERAPSHSRTPSGSSAYRATNGRGAIAQGVATGAIGGGYGPYAYAPPAVEQTPRGNGYANGAAYANGNGNGNGHTTSRFTNGYTAEAPPPPRPREKAAVVAPVPMNTTNTVPQYLWEKDPEIDDALHNPDSRRDYFDFTIFSSRGWVNFGALLILVCGLLMLFLGYPMYYEFGHPRVAYSGYNLGGINGSGQVPDLNMKLLVDGDTPDDAQSRTGTDGHQYNLVFSDEFEQDYRTFNAGDDPYWEAVDLQYWPTGDIEWYDPKAITTQDGNLVITMTMEEEKNLNFVSGMLQSWNKVCFTTGYIEMRVSLPGSPETPGFWPGAWTMGNLGRAGYGATTEGMWPYSYDSCDAGTFPNQTGKDGVPDVSTANSGSPLSFLPGQRVSACTCSGSDHPGPDVTYGRGVPEIDLIEAQIDVSVWRGQVSQSYQIAPFNQEYQFNNDSSVTTIYDDSLTEFNTYKGGQWQQAVSALTYVPDDSYSGSFTTYGVEWYSDPDNRDDGYMTWFVNGEKTWTLTAASIGGDSEIDMSGRLISEEPMYMIINLGMAPSFQQQDFEHMKFPAQMLVDYVRVYQREGTTDGVTCNPPNRPTKDYIDNHMSAYDNVNATTWSEAGYSFPRNSAYDGCT
ncbi:glycoside hydrolase family 16 protein [Schizophyllum amplum]|uniref:Glycoside hydrolase family 16 protein n=1 Tax=Schizophyllum amplum TaxID=97359 RepID=A0A550CH82_9AGAR|nr:glycoside hydrolase family 16 protein [Auriculariopsis ampla]